MPYHRVSMKIKGKINRCDNGYMAKTQLRLNLYPFFPLKKEMICSGRALFIIAHNIDIL